MTRLFKSDVLLASYQIAGGAERRIYMRRKTGHFVLWHRTSSGEERGYSAKWPGELPAFLKEVEEHGGTIHDEVALKEALTLNENDARRNETE